MSGPAQLLPIPRFRFRPRAVEAMQYRADWTFDERYTFLKWCKARITIYGDGILIHTPAGDGIAKDGDWIVKSEGVFYPVPEARFHELYEPES